MNILRIELPDGWELMPMFEEIENKKECCGMVIIGKVDWVCYKIFFNFKNIGK